MLKPPTSLGRNGPAHGIEPMEGPVREVEACSDAELMRRLATGDAAPLGDLFLRYGGMVRAVVARYGSGVTSAEVDDLCQDVFLTLLELAPRYAEEGKLRSFLCGIAVRKAKARRRRYWVRASLLRLFGSQAPGASAMLEGNVETELGARIEVKRALAALPEAQRQVLLMHAVDKLSGEEIASSLGISPNTVWTRLHRARHAMRKALGREEPPRGGGSDHE